MDFLTLWYNLFSKSTQNRTPQKMLPISKNWACGTLTKNKVITLHINSTITTETILLQYPIVQIHRLYRLEKSIELKLI